MEWVKSWDWVIFKLLEEAQRDSIILFVFALLRLFARTNTTLLLIYVFFLIS